jgi:Ca2+-binding EF-hand superfamily protein
MSLPYLALRWDLPLDCLKAAAELFQQHAVLPGLAQDEDYLRDGELHLDELVQVTLKLAEADRLEELPPETMMDLRHDVAQTGTMSMTFQEFAIWHHQRSFMTYMVLTKEERRTREVARKLGIPCAEMDNYKALFEKYDLNHNGSIDLKEFSNLLHCLWKVPDNLHMSQHRIMHFWNECHKSADGAVNFEDFVKFYIQHFDLDSTSPMEEFYRGIRPVHT